VREQCSLREFRAGGSSNPCQWRSRLAHWLVLGLRWGLPGQAGRFSRATIRTRCVHALDVMSTRETPCVVWAFFGWWGHALAPPLYSLPERGARVRTGAHGNAMAGHARRPGLPWADDGPSNKTRCNPPSTARIRARVSLLRKAITRRPATRSRSGVPQMDCCHNRLRCVGSVNPRRSGELDRRAPTRCSADGSWRMRRRTALRDHHQSWIQGRE
jgi:hypothetical protein